MELREIRSAANEVLRTYLTEKDCPKCAAEATMVKVSVWKTNSDEVVVKWRCLNCLTLCTETLTPEASKF